MLCVLKSLSSETGPWLVIRDHLNFHLLLRGWSDSDETPVIARIKRSFQQRSRWAPYPSLVHPELNTFDLLLSGSSRISEGCSHLKQVASSFAGVRCSVIVVVPCFAHQSAASSIRAAFYQLRATAFTAIMIQCCSFSGMEGLTLFSKHCPSWRLSACRSADSCTLSSDSDRGDGSHPRGLAGTRGWHCRYGLLVWQPPDSTGRSVGVCYCLSHSYSARKWGSLELPCSSLGCCHPWSSPWLSSSLDSVRVTL